MLERMATTPVTRTSTAETLTDLAREKGAFMKKIKLVPFAAF
jgi:hypothetical protein